MGKILMRIRNDTKAAEKGTAGNIRPRAAKTANPPLQSIDRVALLFYLHP